MAFRLLAVLVAAALTAGCSGSSSTEVPSAEVPSTEMPGAAPDAAASPTGSPAASAWIELDPSAADDLPGAVACQTLGAAIDEGTLMNPGVVDAIVTASTNADAPIADAAERLQTAFQDAIGSTGTTDEPDAVAAVSAAGAEMSEVCVESGLDAIG